MNATSQELVDLLSALNQTGGIPLKVTATAQTEWTQFAMMMVMTAIGSFVIFIFMWDKIQPALSTAFSYVNLLRIKNLLGRNILVIKHTQDGLFASNMIDIKTLMKVEKAIKKFNGKPFDIILHTPGGQIFATQFLVRILLNYPSKIRAIVPFYAMSGGTLLSLACDEIVMGDTACLGPVDPQIGSIFFGGSAKSWKQVIQKKGRKAEDSSIQMAFVGEQYTQTLEMIVRNLLKNQIEDPNALDAAVKHLTSGDIEHAYPMTRSELAGIGIRTSPLDYRIKRILVGMMQSGFYEGVYYV